MTRVKLTPAAAVYTPNFAHLERYSPAMTAADDHATILCMETNEEFTPALPAKNLPLPPSSYGRSRQAQSLTSSPSRMPVSVRCWLCFASPNPNVETGTAIIPKTNPFDTLALV